MPRHRCLYLLALYIIIYMLHVKYLFNQNDAFLISFEHALKAQEYKIGNIFMRHHRNVTIGNQLT